MDYPWVEHVLSSGTLSDNFFSRIFMIFDQGGKEGSIQKPLSKHCIKYEISKFSRFWDSRTPQSCRIAFITYQDGVLMRWTCCELENFIRQFFLAHFHHFAFRGRRSQTSIFKVSYFTQCFCSAFEVWDRPPPEGKMMKMCKKKLSDEVLELATCPSQ